MMDLQKMMSKIKFPKTCNYNETYCILLILFGITVIGIVFYFMFYYNKEGFEEPSSKSNVATIMLFHVDWCPHCKTALPVWNSVKKSLNGTTINGYVIEFIDYNCTDSNAAKDLLNLYGIEGYPTIKLKRNDMIYDYDASPTEENIEQFIRESLI